MIGFKQTRGLFIATCIAGAGLAGCGPALEPELETEATGAAQQALTEGAALTTHDASCLQLQDQNTWSTYASYMTPVGPALGLSSIVKDLNRAGPVLTSSTRPAAVGYNGGFRWNDGDMATEDWIPQALTAGVSGSTNVAIVSWHYAPTTAPEKGVRISVADISDMSASAVNYRHILLVRPTSSGNFTVIPEHGGGLAWYGNYLYMADTSDGIRVFDLTQIREVDTSTTCDAAIGKVGSVWCAYGYKYVLPQVSAYVVPSSITSPCRPKFSFLGKDTRGTTDVVLSGEYCNNTGTSCPYDGTTPGLGGRLYRWPVDSTTYRLKATSGIVKPERAYIMNEPNVQGVAPIMTTTATTSYWLSSTRYGGALFKVSTSASRTAYLSGSSQWAKMPEGMHATGSGTNLWTVTEGVSGVTNSATGGRVVIYVDQASVN
ncbi:hypothetical protein [Vitiosangium sp. GDMCC 1.1324]|uniref:hypothetical protein n=1 Tax=Vitiosangium sp. (strain GDMCC 1.1324) TaxID=2138576 RepID=UPI000D3C4EB5|nr:hypothetical protein [Vitiosangium sp. GDMCC 1.1324]PTL80900.1 hypothetical protein DAT35_26575 [Vitiosangium sp. GDMCC 1.1324]